MKPSLFLAFFVFLFHLPGLRGADHLEASRRLFDPVEVRRKTEAHERCLARSLGAYERVGRTDARWDAAAKRAFRLYADYSYPLPATNPPTRTEVLTALDRAVAAGCDDPLIRYLLPALGYNKYADRPDDELVNEFLLVAERLEKSDYSAHWKCLAWTDAAAKAARAAGGPRNLPPDLANFTHARRWIKELVTLPATGIEEVYDGMMGIYAVMPRGPELFKTFLEIKPTVQERWPEEPATYRLRGEVNLDEIRRTKAALVRDPKNQNASNSLANAQGVARESFDIAWNLAPTSTELAVDLFQLEATEEPGQGHPERWFQRAMLLDSNCFSACDWKLYFQKGSTENVRQFGRECLASTKWGGDVPLILVAAHRSLAKTHAGLDGEEDYWKQPEVWRDISAAYEKCLAAPGADRDFLRADYALLAMKCQRGSECLRQISQLTSTNYYRFGGRRDFEGMVRDARELMKSPAK